MAETYRISITYRPVPITNLQQAAVSAPPAGAQGVIWLHIDEKRWFAASGDPKHAQLATAQFGAASGTLSFLSGSSGNIEMYVGGKCVGIFDLATLKTTNLSGVIATKWRTNSALIPGTGVTVFTEGLHFARPAAWSDKSDIEKFGELLERARKYARGETATLIVGLLQAIPMVAAVILLLAALGTMAGPAVAGVVAVIAAFGGYLMPRSMEYADRLKIVAEVMRTSNPHDTELEQGAQALAEFFRLVIEDCAFAAMMKGGEMARAKLKPKPAEVVETLDEAFTRHKAEEFDRAAKRAETQKAAPRPAGASYTPEQLSVASEHAFKDMPMFKNRRYAELKQWLTQRGFVWQKAAIFEKNGRNSNAGGSEILVRRSPELEKVGLCEVVRIDRAGHEVRFKDGPVRETVNTQTGEIGTQREGWGGLRHFHKDVVPIDKLRIYCEQFVPDIRSVNDFNNLIDPSVSSKFQQIHIELRP
jgi:hypothetical protein